MKKIDKLFKLMLGLFVIGFMMSCEEDIPGIGNPNMMEEAPSSIAVNESGFISSAATIGTGETFSIKVQSAPGSSKLNDVKFIENGNLILFDRITINGNQAGANPVLLFAPDNDGFTWEVDIKAQDEATINLYEVIITDENDLESKINFEITTEDEAIAPTTNFGSDTELAGEAGSLLSIPVNAMRGSSDLAFVAVSEGMDLIADFSRVYYGNLQTPFSSNPHPLPESDQSGFDQMIFIRLPEDAGSYTYQIFVIDANEQANIFEFTVDVGPSGTAIETLEGILFNAGGPAGTGGLDLDEGISTGSSDSRAEIKDEGIDLDLPAANNWFKQISGTNGSTIRALYPGQNGLPEGFSFGNISVKEELPGLYEIAQELNLLNSAGEQKTAPIVGGEIFIVNKNEQYYLIRVLDVFVAAADNGDYYMIDIKK